MPVGRRIRRQLANWLPERVKAPFRSRRVGFRAPAVGVPATFSTNERGPCVLIENRVTLHFRDEDTEDVTVLLRDNGESVDEMASFLTLASSARLLFDIGAAKGLFSEIFCLSDPARRAVAFEPSPALADAAAALIAANGCDSRIHLRRCAVGAEAGRHTARLYAWGYVGVDVPERADDGGTTVEVEMTSVDREVEQLGIEPDLLKIDVEGYEYEVLVGAKRLLEKRKPPICLELHLDLLDKRGIEPRRVLAELESHGYRLRSCAGQPLRTGDVLGNLNAVTRLVAY
jgi:FkbM family methyltransferase